MSFLSNILDSVMKKKAELDDRKEFSDMVESKAKPLRRKAYMEQMLKEVVQEGIAKAKIDSAKRIPSTKKSPEDFGIQEDSKDQWKYLDEIGKQYDKQPAKSQKTKSKRKNKK